ncbi:MAG: hypothetical protein ACXVO9_12890, partial [Bacteroidia bacterium]
MQENPYAWQLLLIQGYLNQKGRINNKSQKMLLVCDESGITCVTFRNLQRIVQESGREVVLAMPGYQYKEGK